MPENGTTEHRATVEDPRTAAEQRNTPEYQRNTNLTPVKHPGTM